MSVRFVRASVREHPQTNPVVEDLYAGLSPAKRRRVAVQNEVIDLDVEVISETIVRKPASRVSLRKERPVKPSELLRAAQEGDVEAIRAFLRRGADVDHTDTFGWTPLMCAVQAGKKEAVKTLVDVGRANVHMRNDQGKTAFDMALSNRRSDLIEFLVRGGKGRRKREEFVRPDTKPTVSEINLQTIPKRECSDCGQADIPGTHWRQHVASVVHQLAADSQPSSAEPLGQPPFKIPESNVGYQLLVKSGWDTRSGLGKHGKGRKMPLKITKKMDRRGLGEKRVQVTEDTEEAREERRFKRAIEDRVRSDKGKERELREMLSGI